MSLNIELFIKSKEDWLDKLERMAAFQHKLRRYEKSDKFTIINENQSIAAKAKPAAKKPKKAAPNYIENEATSAGSPPAGTRSLPPRAD